VKLPRPSEIGTLAGFFIGSILWGMPLGPLMGLLTGATIGGLVEVVWQYLHAEESPQ
jgi:hypothetical protein